MYRTILWKISLAIILMGGMTGCMTSYPNLPKAEFEKDFSLERPELWQVSPSSKYARYTQILEDYRKRNPIPEVGHKNYTVSSVNDTVLLASMGNYSAAFKEAMTAQEVMTGTVKGELARKLVASLASEDNKIYKGEPYEIAMVNYYIGLFSLIKGDSELAGIGFRRALEADKMSEEDSRDDFHLANFCLGLSCRLQDLQAASIALEKTKYPKGVEEFNKDNFFIFIEIGRSPWKTLYLSGSMDKPMRENYEPRSAEIYVDGEPVGKSFKLVDLYHQAVTTGRSGKDVLQGAKGTLKTIGKNVPLIGGLVDVAWKVNADTRTCYLLPGEVHTFSTHLSADKLHTVTIKFKNVSGRELPRYEQTWHYIRTQDENPTILNVRSEYDKCNVQSPIVLTNVLGFEAGEEGKKISFNTNVLQGKVVPGDRVRICEQISFPEQRFDIQTHWRYEPVEFKRNGEMVPRSTGPLSIYNYELGEIGEAEVISVEGGKAIAKVVSLTTDYEPSKKSLVTNAVFTGRTWRVPR